MLTHWRWERPGRPPADVFTADTRIVAVPGDRLDLLGASITAIYNPTHRGVGVGHVTVRAVLRDGGPCHNNEALHVQAWGVDGAGDASP